MTAFTAPADDDEPTATSATTPFLDTTDAERVEYLYSIPDETEKLDEDFADDWNAVREKADSFAATVRQHANMEKQVSGLQGKSESNKTSRAANYLFSRLYQR